MRFLVVTLHAGEREFDRCIDAVNGQRSVDVEHVVLSGLSNVEAHRRCYGTIQQRRGEFDVAVKIDADMVLRSPATLAEIGQLFRQDPELDHAQLGLHDFYTDRPLMGMQAFSPRVQWEGVHDALFVDQSPIVPGRRAIVSGPPAPVADHSPDPSPVQAFRFGVHRATKAFQRDRGRVRGSQAHEQWQTLTATWDAFVESGDFRRGLAVYGADLVWTGQLDVGDEGYRSGAVEAAFAHAPRDDAELHAELDARWRPSVRRGARRVRTLGPRGTLRMSAAAGRKAIERRRHRHEH